MRVRYSGPRVLSVPPHTLLGMSEFTSESSQAAQEEAGDVQASPERSEQTAAPEQEAQDQGSQDQGSQDQGSGETLGSSTPGDPALEKDPSDWVSGGDPITESQKSYLDTLARQAGEELPADMSKAEASQHIDRLRQQTGQG